MKKSLVVLSIAALALTAAAPVFADEDGGHGDNHLGFSARLEAALHGEGEHQGIVEDLNQSQFVLAGTVVSTTSSSITVKVQKQINVTGMVNGQVTVAVNSSTKLGDNDNDGNDNNDNDDSFTLASIKAGDQVVISGSISGSTLTASSIRLLVREENQVGVAFGSVTALTPTSLTITNSKTGASQTITTDSDTQVRIDGQAAATSDVAVGDRGFVRFENDISGMIAKLIAIFR